MLNSVETGKIPSRPLLIENNNEMFVRDHQKRPQFRNSGVQVSLNFFVV